MYESDVSTMVCIFASASILTAKKYVWAVVNQNDVNSPLPDERQT